MKCPNVADDRESPERGMGIGWDREVSGDFGAALRVEGDNSPGVLAQVAAAIAEAHSNIDGVEYLERDTNVAAIRFSIEVKSRKHLADVIRDRKSTSELQSLMRISSAVFCLKKKTPTTKPLPPTSPTPRRSNSITTTKTCRPHD